MPLSKESLKQRIETELQAQGFKLNGEFSMASKLAEAIANAIVDEMNQSLGM